MSTGRIAAHHDVVYVCLTIQAFDIGTVRMRVHGILKKEDSTKALRTHLGDQFGVSAKRSRFALGSAVLLLNVIICTYVVWGGKTSNNVLVVQYAAIDTEQDVRKL